MRRLLGKGSISTNLNSCSQNMSSSSFEELSNQLGVKAMKNHKKYLGLPTLVERSKTQMFKFVRDRV